jgi:membrane associated rhomboid family serine protease
MFPFGDTNDIGGFAPVTLGLIIANVIVFLLEISAANPDLFIAQYALTPNLVNFSDPATLVPFVTSQFLHGGWLHIGGNMLFLWVFGDNVEHRLGLFYLPFYLAAGVVGGLAQYAVDPHSVIPSLGASGAIAGVLGAYLFLFPKNMIKTLVIFFGFAQVTEIPAPVMLVYWFAIQLFSGVASVATHAVTSADLGGVAYLAHIGGFGFGWLSAHLFRAQSSEVSKV